MNSEHKSRRMKEEDSFRQYLKRRAVRATRGTKVRPEIGPYMYFFHCFGDQSDCIKEMLGLMRKADRDKQKTLNQLAKRNRLSSNFNDVMKELELESKAIAQEEMQDVLAGALFVILNSALRSMSDRVKRKGGKEGPEKAGRKIGKASMYELIRATSNNFRHYEQWNKNVLKNKNIKVLKRAGLKGPWDRNLSTEVFRLTEWKSEKKLSLEIRHLASEIFQHQTGIPL